MGSSPHQVTRNPKAAAPRVPTPRRQLRHDEVLVTGDIGGERIIRTTDLHAHAREPIHVHYVTARFNEVHRIQGVPLHNVLARGDLRVDTRRKMDHLTFVVLAHSEDGYWVLLSWAEIDPEFGASAALLATCYNGRLLTRPTLVAPHDRRSSRYVRALCCLQVARIDAPATVFADMGREVAI